MALELFGMTGTKLYIAIIAMLVVLSGAMYVVLDLGGEPYTLSGEDDDTFSVDYVNEGESYVSFTSDPIGATLEINDKTYITPTGNIELDSGSYSYVVTLDNYVTKMGDINVEDEKSKTLNVVLESIPLELIETPTPEPTETSTGTATGTPTPTGTETYDIPFGAVNMRFVAGTAFQGVDTAGAVDEARWLSFAGKTLYLRDRNVIEFSQTSGYPNGVGDTLIEYEDEVSTSFMEFEHLQTYGSRIDWKLTYTGNEDNGFVSIANILAGSIEAPDQAGPMTVKINVVPKSYGFWFDVQKKDDSGPVIVGNKAEPVGIYASSWALASWHGFTDPVIYMAVSGAQGEAPTVHEIHGWAFWETYTVDSGGNWVGEEATTRVIIRANDAHDFDRIGEDKVLYIRMYDLVRADAGDDPDSTYSEYKLTYDVDLGNVDNIRVKKID
mgnify:CR=1 FL=1